MDIAKLRETIEKQVKEQKPAEPKEDKRRVVEDLMLLIQD
jgi:hypothetical protein